MQIRLSSALDRAIFLLCCLIGFAVPCYAWLPGSSSPEPISGLSVDASDRTDVAMFFQCVYKASDVAAATMNWNGSVSGCSPGTTSAEFKNHTLRRINWFRAMTGVTADITFDTTKNTMSQQAALMMAAQNSLSHTPGTNWACYTAAGAEAAGKSNLALGSSGPRAINQYIQDSGSNNIAVGHRRWILSPRVVEMGTGDIPGGAGHNDANCLWVIGDSRSPTPPAQESYWPPKGYVPWQTVWARWSYSYSGANFASANVTITREGSSVPLTVESRTANGYGENTIVFNAPSTVGTVSEDTTYTVTITNISGAGPDSVTYDVTVIDPDQLADEIVISGPAQATSSGEEFGFTPISGASQYELAVSRIDSNSTSEGAEDSTSSAVLDHTNNQDVRIANGPRTGSKCFRLHPAEFYSSEDFEIDRDFLPTAESALIFHVREGYATPGTILSAEVSPDGGSSWVPLWEQAGQLSAQSSYAEKNLSLNAYAGMAIRVRFRIRHEGGSKYTGSGAQLGFRIDDISVSNSSLATPPQLTTLPSSSSSFVLDSSTAGGALTEGNRYLMRVRPVFDCASFGFGPAMTVEVEAASGFDRWLADEYPNLNGGFAGDHDGDGVPNALEFVLGSDPTDRANSAPEPEFSNNMGSLSFQPTASITGVRCIGQYSQDLEDWIDLSDSDPGPAYTFSVPTQNMDRVFMRLKVVRE